MRLLTRGVVCRGRLLRVAAAVCVGGLWGGGATCPLSIALLLPVPHVLVSITNHKPAPCCLPAAVRMLLLCTLLLCGCGLCGRLGGHHYRPCVRKRKLYSEKIASQKSKPAKLRAPSNPRGESRLRIADVGCLVAAVVVLWFASRFTNYLHP